SGSGCRTWHPRPGFLLDSHWPWSVPSCRVRRWSCLHADEARLGRLRLGQFQRQDAVVIASLDAVDVELGGQRQAAIEGPFRPLLAVIADLLALALDLALSGDREPVLHGRDRELVGLDARHLGAHVEMVGVLAEVDGWEHARPELG